MSTPTADRPPERWLPALLRRITSAPNLPAGGGALALEPVVCWPTIARVPGAARRLRQQRDLR